MKKVIRGISVVPTYMLAVVALIIVGIIVASTFANVFLPISVQKAYLGGAIRYEYKIEPDKVVIVLANPKNYDAKADILLINSSNDVLTSCNGYIASSLRINKTEELSPSVISLLGIEVRPQEIVTITCYERNIKTVKVLEYGVTTGEQGEALIGTIGGGYEISNPSFGLGQPWQIQDLYYRLPITVVATKQYNPAYVKVELSPNTLPTDIYNFIKTHTRPDLNDVLVVGIDNTKYPTKASREFNKIIVTFKVENLPKGVHRYFIYFGNPKLDKPIKPLNENPVPGRIIATSLPVTIQSSLVYPAYMIPEANWLPVDDDLRFGVIKTEDKPTFDNYVATVKNGDYNSVKQLIDQALKTKTDFPIGTRSTNQDYRHLRPKTIYGNAPWATVVVVPLPKIVKDAIPSGTSVTAKLWVSSDDGSGAYLVSLKSSSVYRVKIYEDIYIGHGPKYWNYPARQVYINLNDIDGGNNYLVILQQNGICGCTWWYCACGNGPGWLDFRFVMWYIEKLSENAPSVGDFTNLYQGYIDVTVYGIDEDLYGYALPVDITGRNDVDWTIFKPESVYVVSLTDFGQPLYYWPEIEDLGATKKVIIWVKIPHLPRYGKYRFRIYYGGENKYPSYNNPNKVFVFFDDFDGDPKSSGKWKIFGAQPIWVSNKGYIYLIKNRYASGTQMYMKNIDWRKGFHVHFKMKITGRADGMAFFFFKQENYVRAVSSDGSLGLYTYLLRTGLTPLPGYAIVFDIYRNSGDPDTPYIGLVETYGYSIRHIASRYNDFKNSWIHVDIYYHGSQLKVFLNYGDKPVLNYYGNIFNTLGIKYGGMGFSAATSGLTGTFAIDRVFLRYYPGKDPSITIVGHLPSEGSGGTQQKIYDFESETVSCYTPRTWNKRCEFRPSGFWYYSYRTSGGIYGASLSTTAYHGSKSLYAVIGDKSNNMYYSTFSAEVRFPKPLATTIIFYYKATGYGTRAVIVQGYDGSRWVPIKTLPTNTNWIKVTINNANKYQEIRIYFYVYTSSVRYSAKQEIWLDYVIYQG